jgi:hypothetical protein
MYILSGEMGWRNRGWRFYFFIYFIRVGELNVSGNVGFGEVWVGVVIGGSCKLGFIVTSILF